MTSSFYKEHCSLLPFLILWFIFSIVLSMTNRYVFGILNFPVLLTATSIHFLGQFIFSMVYTSYYDKTNSHLYSTLSWRTYLAIAIPVGVSSALDIALSNMGMSLAPISVCTIVKAATPLFVLLLSFGMKLAQPTWRLCCVVVLITAGELLMVKKTHPSSSAAHHDLNTTDHVEMSIDSSRVLEWWMLLASDNNKMENDHPLSCDPYNPSETKEHQLWMGIIFMLLSSFFSAVRWTVLQWKLPTLPEPLRCSPMATLRLISPSMFASLLPIAIGFEHARYYLLGTCSNVAIGLGFGSGLVLAIPLMLSEYALLIRSSAIVLMIGGVCKEICTIFFGIVVFHEVVTGRAWLGFLVVTAGVCLYKVDKLMQKQQEQSSSLPSLDDDVEEQQQSVHVEESAPPISLEDNDLEAHLLEDSNE